MAQNNSLEEIRSARLEKLKKIREAGMNPYTAHSGRTHRIADILENFSEIEASGETVTISGRVMAKRGQGAIMFTPIYDGTGKFQAVFKKDVLGDKLDFLKDVLDSGDFIDVTGKLFITNTGQESVLAEDYKILTKSLLPLPDKREGLKDKELKLRKRYLDILMDEELFARFKRRTKFWDATRDFLKSKGFQEVETPTIEVTTGGAEATPFKTYHNDFGIDVYMRISVGELWQKRLMAAGFEKTFEIGRVYRNEGSSPDHLQEFTNMEYYWAYADYRDGMELTKEFYEFLAKEVYGRTEFEARGHKFDLSSANWEELDYRSAVKEITGIDVLEDDLEAMIKRAQEFGIEYKNDVVTKERLIDTMWKYCRKQIAGPVFLINHPKIISPLSKSKEDNPELTERFQPILAGSEVGNGFSELNDPIDQRERFEAQQELLKKGDNEAMMPEWEFVEMLEHGMPPTCGFGFGERMFGLLEGVPLREVTLFPLVKPKRSEEGEGW